MDASIEAGKLLIERDPDSPLDKRVKRNEVMMRYGYSKSALYLAIENRSFPRSHCLAGGRTRYWWESELLEYERTCKTE